MRALLVALLAVVAATGCSSATVETGNVPPDSDTEGTSLPAGSRDAQRGSVPGTNAETTGYAKDDFLQELMDQDLEADLAACLVDLLEDAGFEFRQHGELTKDEQTLISEATTTCINGTTPGTAPAMAPVYRAAQLVPLGTNWQDALDSGAIVTDEIPAEFRPDSAVTPDRQPTGAALFDLAAGTVIVIDMFAG